MTIPQRERIEELLIGLLESPEPERAQIERQLALEDESVQREVRSMIALFPKAQEYFHEFENNTGGQDATGRMAGAYRIIARIGSGGMGTVYRAERNDGEFRREVAVKFLTPLAAGEESWRRFQMEKQILAKLRHPNIAQLLDAGLDENGTPFLVMEYVAGEPIDRYLEINSPPLRQRLQLFLRICEAVQAAHQQLVVHRDIKPGNVLVTADGTPKLLDFGIAKALGGEMVDSHRTRPQDRVMTLAWASPEQVRGEPIHTSSDVYSLGLLLYLVLTGREALEKGDMNPAERMRAIYEVDPRRPSLVAEPDWVARQLRGDLDNIVLQALRKSPADRYATAQSLADDVQRHLDGWPVSASQPTAAYRIRKFAGRHAWACAAGVMIAALLSGAAGSVVWQARVAETERKAAVAARAIAESERATAETRSAEALQARSAATAGQRIAEEQHQSAEDNRLIAQKRFEEVRALANSVLFVYQGRLAQSGTETALRARMAQDSMTYLDRLAVQSSDNPKLLLEAAAGYRELARLLGDRSAPNLGDFPGAAASLAKSRRLVDAAVRSSPGNLDAAKQLAALTCLEPRILQRKASGCVAAWESLRDRAAADVEVLAGLKTAYFWQTADPSQPCAHLVKYLEVAEQVRAARPGIMPAARDVALGHKYLATCLQVRDVAAMKIHAERAIALDESILAKENTPQARLDLSFGLSTMASYYEQRHEDAAALPLFERVTKLRRENFETDSSNVWLQQRLVGAYLSLGRTHHTLGQTDGLRIALEEISRILPRMRVSDDTEWQRVLMQFHTFRALAMPASERGGPAQCAALSAATQAFNVFTKREPLDKYKSDLRAWVEKEFSLCPR